MNANSRMTTLPSHHSTGHQPWLSELSPTNDSGHGARHPPRKSVVASADTVMTLMYSARKNMANFNDEYSVWKPATSSLSASGRSNGARLVSPTIETRYIRNDGISGNAYQSFACALTIWLVDSEPA